MNNRISFLQFRFNIVSWVLATLAVLSLSHEGCNQVGLSEPKGESMLRGTAATACHIQAVIGLLLANACSWACLLMSLSCRSKSQVAELETRPGHWGKGRVPDPRSIYSPGSLPLSVRTWGLDSGIRVYHQPTSAINILCSLFLMMNM